MRNRLILIAFLLLMGGWPAYSQQVTGNITAVDTSGACTTANGYVKTQLLSNDSSLVVQVSGTFSGTLQFLVTVDGSTYSTVLAYPPNSTTGATTTTGTGKWSVSVGGWKGFCIDASALASGTAAITINHNAGVNTGTLTGGGGGGSGTVTSVATTSPVTGGPITGSGTIACAACAIGPGSSTANHIAEFSSTDGVTLKDGGAAPTGTVTNVSGTVGQFSVSNPTTTPTISGLAVYNADVFPSSCTVSAVNYTTQLDCAFYTAVAAAGSSSNTTTVVLGTNYYNTCAGLVEPTGFPTVNIIGQGVRNSFINQSCSLGSSTPVIKKAEPSQAGDLLLRDFTVQANGNAYSCMDIWGVINGYIGRINCNGFTTGSAHAIQIGEPDFGAGLVSNTVLDQISVSSPYNHPNTMATITANVVGGSVTSYTVNNGGSYSSTTDAQVLVYGYGAGNKPCSTMPIGQAITWSGGGPYVVSAISEGSNTGGSGCTGTVSVQIAQIYPVTYAFDLWIADSTIYDLVPDNVGSTAGMVIHGGTNTILHAHPTNVQTGILNEAQNDILGTECDAVLHYCIDSEVEFAGFTQSSIVGTVGYTSGFVLPGSAAFYLGTGAYVSFGPQQNLCSGGKPTNWYEFVTPSGAVDGGAASLPTGVSVLGNDNYCATYGDYSPSLNVGALKIAGSSLLGLRGTASTGTPTISSNACSSAITVSATGVATTSTINATFSTNPTGVVGFEPGAMLTIIPVPTSNNVNFYLCNNTGSSLTIGSALTINWVAW